MDEKLRIGRMLNNGHSVPISDIVKLLRTTLQEIDGRRGDKRVSWDELGALKDELRMPRNTRASIDAVMSAAIAAEGNNNEKVSLSEFLEQAQIKLTAMDTSRVKGSLSAKELDRAPSTNGQQTKG
ncbi:MAG: hypothetical protein ABL857_06545 [Rickettsiales bacterium]